MEIHHGKHHQTYINKLNAALEGTDLAEKSVEDLVRDLPSVPEAIRGAVRNHGGGHVNHSFFWPILKKDVSLEGAAKEAIDQAFSGFDQFKEAFTKAATGLFGSGWAWLVLNQGKLEIMTTPNQDSPISQGLTPVLGIDVWEHAYYLTYQNRRPDYVEAFFKIINWDMVNQHLEKAR